MNGKLRMPPIYAAREPCNLARLYRRKLAILSDFRGKYFEMCNRENGTMREESGARPRESASERSSAPSFEFSSSSGDANGA